MKNKKIIKGLAMASAAVMSSGSVNAQSEDLFGGDFKSSFYYYSEEDRVDAYGAIISADFRINQRDTLNFKLTVDSLTGASASGAVATDRDQTFTQPSGDGEYTIGANSTPLDPSFLDTRYALESKWSRRWDFNNKTALGLNFSNEYDYTTLGLSSLYSYTTDSANTVYTAGVSYAYDTIDPEGGIPSAFGVMQRAGLIQPRRVEDTETKTTLDLLFGVTQVIDERSLFQINYSVSSSSGYHSDPFKVLSVVGADGRPEVEDAGANLSRVVFENRPDSRLKQSIYFQYKRDLFNGHVFDTSYRFFFDDWGVNSHTLDFRYKFKLTEKDYIQPHLRIYQQSEADFYQPFILSGSQPSVGDRSAEASADHRLAEFIAYTVGVKYGRENIKHPWSVSLEYYFQDLAETEGAFGELLNQDLNEGISAVTLRFNMDF